jgi:3-(methylthio)propanoyl-CoA dehydrogenase
VREAQQRRVDLLIPVVKAWSTDLGVEIASLGVQVHGGMGYVEETGAAQHLRDARIAPIYEGTNGIQANDLLGRKLMRDKGAAAEALIAEMRETASALAEAGEDLAAIGGHLCPAIDALAEATAWIVGSWDADPARTIAGAVPYLKLMGTVAGGWLMARSALAAQRRLAEGSGDAGFNRAKLATARFYAEQNLPGAAALLPAVRGGATVMGFDLDAL